ncbi:cyclic nucleotide-gated cation channel beta-1 [Lolium rigidum]|uniref:cyclic nucleotide-gated cation channel beta-1 n=1 Tax=Lolium rigidum TaxID=89674 RepID=UPI001F5DD2C0|nr:cyclic nucleotide-gated cation channel beta-1 [Lolium rigidum]
MVAISMYRGNLHRAGDDAARQWQVPPPTLSASRFRRLLRSRSLAVSRLAGAHRPNSPGSSRNPRLDEVAEEPAREAEEVDGDQQEEGHDVQPQQLQHQQEEEGNDLQQQEVEEEEEGQDEQQQGEDMGEEEEQEEGAVEDVEMDDAGEVVVGDGDASGNGDPEEGQGESEGFDPNPEVSYHDGVEERKRELTDKLDTLSKKKHDLVQMLKQILNAEEEIRKRSIQASSRAAMPQPSENAADGSFVPRQVPRMTVDVNFSEFAGESDAGSNQGTPGRPMHHVHNISPSTTSLARSPFGSLHHNSGHTPRSPFSTASPSRFAGTGHHGHPSASLPGSNFVASSPSPAASGGSSSVFRDYRPPNST